MKTAAVIALFSIAGGLSRYYFAAWVYNHLGRFFPYGTFAVNIIGAYFIGLIMELALRTTMIPGTLRVGLTVGLMGGLTTFSTFSYETFRLLEEGRVVIAFANIVTSVAACLLLTWLGVVTVRTLT